MSEALLGEIRDLLIEIRDLLKDRSGSDTTSTSIDQASNEPSQQSWEQYLEAKDPDNDYKIIALVVDKLTSSEKQSVTKEEIVEFIRENPDRITNADPKKLRSVIDNTKNMARYGYIEFVSKDDKTYRLSIKGKQLIKRLPDRESDPKKKS